MNKVHYVGIIAVSLIVLSILSFMFLRYEEVPNCMPEQELWMPLLALTGNGAAEDSCLLNSENKVVSTPYNLYIYLQLLGLILIPIWLLAFVGNVIYRSLRR